jgi:hypothetical protein
MVQLNVDPPPANVLDDAEVIEIVPVPVPAVVVKPVGAALLNAVPEPDSTILPPLNVMFFVPAPVVNEPGTVNVKPARSRVPALRVTLCPTPKVMAKAEIVKLVPLIDMFEFTVVLTFALVVPWNSMVPPMLQVLNPVLKFPRQSRTGVDAPKKVAPLVPPETKLAQGRVPDIVMVEFVAPR